MKYANSPMAMSPEETDNNRKNILLLKLLHEVFFQDQQENLQVDLEQSWQWLCMLGLCLTSVPPLQEA
eukprot:8301114-Ditylum_brightwellii.AAC.2